jgi:hypothetical protein
MKKSFVPVLLVIGGIASVTLSESVHAQNVIGLNSALVQQCKKPTTFDREYQVEGLCNFLHVTTFIRGQFNQVVVNNESMWTMLTTQSGQPIGICYIPGAKVNQNLYTFQCPVLENNQSSAWQNSGNTGYYGNQQIQRTVPRVCADSGRTSTTSARGSLFGWDFNTSGTTYSNERGCNY